MSDPIRTRARACAPLVAVDPGSKGHACVAHVPLILLGGLVIFRDSAHHVIQEAGDVLFVPRGWSHGVLNLRFSIGVAREFDSVFGRY